MCFSKSSSSIASTPDHVKCISLNTQQRLSQFTLINLHSNENIEGLRYYPFAVNLERCVEILLMIYPIKYVFQAKQMI